MKADEIISELKKHSNPKNLEGMARFGINVKDALAVSIPVLRKMAKKTGKDHELAVRLLKTGIHEAKILSGMIADPEKTDEGLMEAWVKDFDSWDLCDQVCMNLFDRASMAKQKAIEWSSREEEFVKRAGFALMAVLAVHNKKADDNYFLEFFPCIVKGAADERNYVKKAVNWALRQIGKRNESLKIEAIRLCSEILLFDSKAAKWIVVDALRELR